MPAAEPVPSGAATAAPPRRAASLQVPWFDSPFFPEQIASRAGTAEQRRLAWELREHGFLVLEDWLDPQLIERARSEVEPLFVPDVPQGPRSRGRVQDGWRECPAVRELAGHPRVLELLRWLYDREPFPFQTLSFRYGTEQHGHSDRSHFDSVPGGFMCGLWVALEDVGPDNGTLFYYPGSHRLPHYSHDDLGLGFSNPNRTAPRDEDARRSAAEAFLERLMAAAGFRRHQLEAKKGTALLWAAGLVHGGSPIRRPGSTRWSQVTHYFFRDCLYVTPMYGNATVGDVYLRETHDVITGLPVPHRYHGLEVGGFTGNGLYKLLLDVEIDGDGEHDVLRAVPPRQLKGIAEERDLLRVNVRDYQQIVESLTRSVSFRLGKALTAPLRLLRP